jgi:hypothetical protein
MKNLIARLERIDQWTDEETLAELGAEALTVLTGEDSYFVVGNEVNKFIDGIGMVCEKNPLKDLGLVAELEAEYYPKNTRWHMFRNADYTVNVEVSYDNYIIFARGYEPVARTTALLKSKNPELTRCETCIYWDSNDTSIYKRCNLLSMRNNNTTTFYSMSNGFCTSHKFKD